jgi:hypothetical protein
MEDAGRAGKIIFEKLPIAQFFGSYASRNTVLFRNVITHEAASPEQAACYAPSFHVAVRETGRSGETPNE